MQQRFPSARKHAVAFDATSGTSSISTNYTTTGGLKLNMGFFVDYLIVVAAAEPSTVGFGGIGACVLNAANCRRRTGERL
jgi:hypothetical protein